jgi:hypothetical protein
MREMNKNRAENDDGMKIIRIFVPKRRKVRF